MHKDDSNKPLWTEQPAAASTVELPDDAYDAVSDIDDHPETFRHETPPMILGIVLMYGLMLGVGLIWTHFSSRTLIDSFAPVEFAAEMVMALLIGILFVGCVGLVWKHTFIFRNVEPEFARRLGRLDLRGVVSLAIISSVAEEVIFRGAAQNQMISWFGPIVGVTVTSLLFGLLHTGPSRAFVAWTAFATVAGFLLGIAYLMTGNLLVPIVIHFIINAVNMWLIVNRAKWRQYQQELRTS